MTEITDFDIKSPIKINLLVMKICGYWPENGKYNLKSFYTLYLITWYLIVLVHVAFQFVNYFYIYDQVEVIASSLYVGISDFSLLVKALIYLFSVRHLKCAFDALDDPSFRPKNSRQLKSAKYLMKIWKTFYLAFGVPAYITVILWYSYPILDGSYKEKKLPFVSWFPYDPTPSPVYELTYFHQAIGVTMICTLNFNLDTLMGCLMMYIAIQCEILCDNLRHLQEEPDEHGKVNARAFNRAFSKCCSHHKKILRFVRYSSILINRLLSVQLIATVLALCMTMMQLTVVKPLSAEFYACVAYQLAVLQQILIYCWFGNEIMERSSKIAYAVFESSWIEHGDSQFWKNMIFFIHKTQKPIEITAFNNFFSLSLESFVKILKSSWSYFAVLNSFKND